MYCGRFGGIGLLICLAVRLNHIVVINGQTFEGVTAIANEFDPAPASQLLEWILQACSSGGRGFDARQPLLVEEDSLKGIDGAKDPTIFSQGRDTQGKNVLFDRLKKKCPPRSIEYDQKDVREQVNSTIKQIRKITGSNISKNPFIFTNFTEELLTKVVAWPPEQASQEVPWYKDALEEWNEVKKDITIGWKPFMSGRIEKLFKDIEPYAVYDWLSHPLRNESTRQKGKMLIDNHLAREVLAIEGFRISEDLIKAFVQADKRYFTQMAMTRKLQALILNLGGAAATRNLFSIAGGPRSVDMALSSRAIENFFWPKLLEVAVADGKNFIHHYGIQSVWNQELTTSAGEKFVVAFGIHPRRGAELQLLQHYLQIYEKNLESESGMALCSKMKRLLEAIRSEGLEVTPEILKTALSEVGSASLNKKEQLFFEVFLFQLWNYCAGFLWERAPVEEELRNFFSGLSEGVQVFEQYVEFYRMVKQLLPTSETKDLKSDYLTLIDELTRNKLEVPPTIGEFRDPWQLFNHLSKHYDNQQIVVDLALKHPIWVRTVDQDKIKELLASGKYELLSKPKKTSGFLEEAGFPQFFYNEVIMLVQALLDICHRPGNFPKLDYNPIRLAEVYKI